MTDFISIVQAAEASAIQNVSASLERHQIVYIPDAPGNGGGAGAGGDGAGLRRNPTRSRQPPNAYCPDDNYDKDDEDSGFTQHYLQSGSGYVGQTKKAAPRSYDEYWDAFRDIDDLAEDDDDDDDRSSTRTRKPSSLTSEILHNPKRSVEHDADGTEIVVEKPKTAAQVARIERELFIRKKRFFTSGHLQRVRLSTWSALDNTYKSARGRDETTPPSSYTRGMSWSVLEDDSKWHTYKGLTALLSTLFFNPHASSMYAGTASSRGRGTSSASQRARHKANKKYASFTNNNKRASKFVQASLPPSESYVNDSGALSSPYGSNATHKGEGSGGQGIASSCYGSDLSHGTRVHEEVAELVQVFRERGNVRSYIQSERSRPIDPCTAKVFHFLECSGLVPLYAEYPVFYCDARVATAIDLVCISITDRYIVFVEIKTTTVKHKSDSLFVSGRTMVDGSSYHFKAPLGHVIDTPLNRAALQLVTSVCMLLQTSAVLKPDKSIVLFVSKYKPRALSYRLPSWCTSTDAQVCIFKQLETMKDTNAMEYIQDSKSNDSSTSRRKRAKKRKRGVTAHQQKDSRQTSNRKQDCRNKRHKKCLEVIEIYD